MGFPAIIYGAADITNHSFETDSAGDPPTGWDTTDSTNGDQAVRAEHGHTTNLNNVSDNALEQNVTAATAGNKATARQRFALSNLLPILQSNGGWLGASAVMYPEGPKALTNARLFIRQYDNTGTSTPGSGVLLTPPESSFYFYGGPEHYQALAGVKVHEDTAWVDVVLSYELAVTGDYGFSASAYWDRVFLGGLIDFQIGSKGLKNIQFKPDPGFFINKGDGVVEVVKLYQARNEVVIDVVNVHEGSSLGIQFEMFLDWVQSAIPGQVVLWGDRDKLNNHGRHFDYLVVDPTTPKVKYPKGVYRRNYTIKFIAAREYM